MTQPDHRQIFGTTVKKARPPKTPESGAGGIDDFQKYPRGHRGRRNMGAGPPVEKDYQKTVLSRPARKFP